jgi:hypothetical protein
MSVSPTLNPIRIGVIRGTTGLAGGSRMMPQIRTAVRS